MPIHSLKQRLTPPIKRYQGQWVLLAVCVFVCALFTCTATALIGWVMYRMDVMPERIFALKLVLRLLIFGLFSAASVYVICTRATSTTSPLNSTHPTSLSFHKESWACAIVLFFLCLVSFVNAGNMPWTAPDEVHHLIVARNLAEFGLYASGNPQQGFIPFDLYDSVGASVIMPIAAIFKLAGTSVGHARYIMASYFLFLSIALYFLGRPVWGSIPSLIGVMGMTVSFGSIYLARTLYGEVPALMWFVVGLLCWRYSIQGKRPVINALLAGICFGLGILAKNIMILSAFCFLGVILLDWTGHRKIHWKAIVFPAVGVVIMLGLWGLYQQQGNAGDSSPQNLVVYYKNYLLFGFPSVSTTINWIVKSPLACIVAITALFICMRTALFKIYDPAFLVLGMIAVFFGFWWIFFTDGHIPRYYWYSCAIGGYCIGVLAPQVIAFIRNTEARFKRRMAVVAMSLIFLGVSAPDYYDKVSFCAHDEMQDEYAVIDYLKSTPVASALATTYWPMERIINFSLCRSVKVVDKPSSESFEGILIVNVNQREIPEGAKEIWRHGKYSLCIANQKTSS